MGSIPGGDPWWGRCRFMLGLRGPIGVVDKAAWWEARRHGFDP